MFSNFDSSMDWVKECLKNVFLPLKSFFDIFSNPWISFSCVSFVFVLFLIYSILKNSNDFKKHMSKARSLGICSLLIALNIVLGYFTLPFSTYLRVGFGFVTQPIVALMFGPLTACVTGMMQDIISLLINPVLGGPYNPTYTISVGIAGMIYGLMLYNKPVGAVRVFLTKLIVIVFANIVLNSIALAPTVGSGLIGILPSRIIKNLIMLPIQTIVVYIILKFVKKIVKVSV